MEKKKWFLTQVGLCFYVILLFCNSVQAETTNCTPITTSMLPYTINTQGIYCLTGNLETNMTTGAAITVATNNVVIDLNGFKVGGLWAGPSTQAIGIYANQRQNITIRNGTVRGFLKAIVLNDISPYTTSQAHLIEDIRADMNTYEGLEVSGRGNLVRNNNVVDTGGSTAAGYVNAYGIIVQGSGAKVMGNNVFETAETGGGASSVGVKVNEGPGSVVEDNRIGNQVMGVGTSTGVEINGSTDVMAVNNRIAKVTIGVNYVGSTGSYRDNILRGVTTPYIGGTEIARGSITSVIAGTGLTGGATSGDATLSVAVPYQLPQSCANGQIPSWNGSAWGCAADQNSGGTITGVTAGNGLTGGGTSGSVTLNVGAGPGIGVAADTVSVSFGGTGSATTAARSDHGHFGSHWIGSAPSASYGLNVENTGTGDGIRAFSSGTDPVNAGVYAYNSSSGSGVLGSSLNGYGLWGDSTSGTGVRGESDSNDGVYGISTSGHGVYGYCSNSGISGVVGEGKTGVVGMALSKVGYGGIFHNSTGSGTDRGVAVAGFSGSGSSSDTHPTGTTYYNAGGEFAGPTGVIGAVSSDANGGIGVIGLGGSGGTGVYGSGGAYGGYFDGDVTVMSGEVNIYTPSLGGSIYFGGDHLAHFQSGILGNAGYFQGNVGVNGNFFVTGTKSFKIDHPLDPVNKYLLHYAIESPTVQNIYNGTIALDAYGEAVVQLPDYFAAVNTEEFTYTLTPIGASMPSLYVVEEVQNNQFKISGGVGGKKVSWMVIGQRNDPWMKDHPAKDVLAKAKEEMGTYLYPKGYGQPETLGREKILLKKQNRQ
jgi:hypothetical protein